LKLLALRFPRRSPFLARVPRGLHIEKAGCLAELPNAPGPTKQEKSGGVYS